MAAWTLHLLLQGVNPPHPSGLLLTQVFLLLLLPFGVYNTSIDPPSHSGLFFFGLGALTHLTPLPPARAQVLEYLCRGRSLLLFPVLNSCKISCLAESSRVFFNLPERLKTSWLCHVQKTPCLIIATQLLPL